MIEFWRGMNGLSWRFQTFVLSRGTLFEQEFRFWWSIAYLVWMEARAWRMRCIFSVSRIKVATSDCALCCHDSGQLSGGWGWLCCLYGKGVHTVPKHRHPKMELDPKLTSSTVLSISAKYSLLSLISFSSAWISCSFCFSSSCLAAISSSLSASRWSFSEVTFSSWNFLSNKECLKSEIGGLQPISRETDNNAAMYNCWWTNKRS